MRKMYILLLFLAIIVIFLPWFNSLSLTGGDWHYLFSSALNTSIPGVWAWDFSYGNGLGGNDIFLLGLNSYFMSGSYFLLQTLSLPWWLVERIMWYWPFLLNSCFSSYFLHRTFFKKNKFWIFSVLVFVTNTYTLMLIGGGQVGVAEAFAFSPFILGMCATLIKSLGERNKVSMNVFFAVITGVILGLQIFFDLRIAYITLIAVLLFILLSLSSIISPKKISFLLVTFFIAFFLNFFWIFPQSLLRSNPLAEMGSAYTTSGAVEYFSFAKFEDAFGLLHPNWPENIFGKVGFVKPEFLLLPILAFSSLLFINNKGKTDEEKKEKVHVIYFALVGLVGIFLAKGANDPFGNIYLWMFGHIPGFVMFRDPTKWYLLIGLSYSMLIPFSISKVYELLKRRFV